MSKRKGVSADEKRTRMLQLFYEKNDFFQLKELEKIAPKEKGITMQSVKEVVQALVDDHLVETEKIGTSIYFWAFPSKAKNALKRKLEENVMKLETAEKRIKTLEESINLEKVGRQPGDSRNEILTRLKNMMAEEERLKQNLQQYRDFDPEVVEQLKMETTNAKEAIDRWTDNIFAARAWCKNKFGIDEKQLNQNFGIPHDLDFTQ